MAAKPTITIGSFVVYAKERKEQKERKEMATKSTTTVSSSVEEGDGYEANNYSEFLHRLLSEGGKEQKERKEMAMKPMITVSSSADDHREFLSRLPYEGEEGAKGEEGDGYEADDSSSVVFFTKERKEKAMKPMITVSSSAVFYTKGRKEMAMKPTITVSSSVVLERKEQKERKEMAMKLTIMVSSSIVLHRPPSSSIRRREKE